MKTGTKQAKIITHKDIEQKQSVPSIWKRVAGLFVGKNKINAAQYQRAVRKEWQG
ncbi:hypothetical protein HYZ76_01035 [Candidatus Falkowbacteria bacterium]|nr:hypothetical protein [Candidatus Falkowbacteria bacterium]